MQNIFSHSNISARLETLMKELNIKPIELARSCGVSKGYVSMLLSGKTKIGYDFMTGLYAAHNVNTNWLISGNGKMFNELNSIALHEPKESYTTNNNEVLILQAKLEECRETVARLAGNVQSVNVLTKKIEV
jgi:transcriptional regulator with XRE-family HTH domain